MEKAADAKWFDQELRTLLHVINHSFSVKPSVIERYWDAVQVFSRSEVEFALGSIGKDKTEHFTPGHLKVAAQLRRNAKRRHEEETSSRNQKRIEHTAGDDAAWESSMAECRRLLATNN